MLIELAKDAVGDLGRRSVCNALLNLALAYRAGQHILCVSPDICNSITEAPHIDALTKAAFRQAAVRYPEISGLRRMMSFYVKVHGVGRQHDDWHCSIEWFSEHSALQPSIIVCEHYHDSMLFFKFAQGFISKQKWRCKLSCDLGSGAGGAITGTLDALSSQSRFVLVLVDTDRDHQSAAEGSTLKGVRKWVAAHSQWTASRVHLQAMDAHEIENIIPLSLLRNILSGSDSEIVDLIELAHSALEGRAKFLDLKSGTTAEQIRALHSGLTTTLPPQLLGKPDALVIRPLPDCVKNCSNHVSKLSPQKVAELFTPAELSSIAEQLKAIVAISCATAPFCT